MPGIFLRPFSDSHSLEGFFVPAGEGNRRTDRYAESVVFDEVTPLFSFGFGHSPFPVDGDAAALPVPPGSI